MAIDPSEMLGFETKREIREENRPDLHTVPAGLEFVADELRQLLPDIDGEDSRVDFLIELIETLPPETVDIAGQISRSNTDAVSRLGPIVLPELLRRAVYSDKFSSDDLDALRQMWAHQMNHPGSEVRSSAIQAFRREEAYLLENDVTTYGMLLPTVEARTNPPQAPLSRIHGPEFPELAPKRSYSEDIALKALGKARHHHEYLRDHRGQIVGVIQ
jgi:hypothetical protein